jgi:DNA-binding transcriptional LysR family regulator
MLLIDNIDNIIVMDNIYKIRIFINLSKTLNFTETAKQMHLVQPAVSRHIKNLEEELGKTLFIRRQKKVLLTTSGKNLLLEVTPWISEFDRIFSEYTENVIAPKGELKIGSMAEAGNYILMDYLIEFQKEFSEIQLVVEYSGSLILQQKLLNGELDFALVSRYTESKNLEALPLFSDQAVLVGSRSRNTFDTKDKKLLFVIYNEDDYYTKNFLKKNLTEKMRKKIQILGSVSSHEAMFQWILKRNAFCVVPKSSYEKSKYVNDLKIFKEDNKQTYLYLIYLYNAKSEFRKKVFLDQMSKVSFLLKNNDFNNISGNSTTDENRSIKR